MEVIWTITDVIYVLKKHVKAAMTAIVNHVKEQTSVIGCSILQYGLLINAHRNVRIAVLGVRQKEQK
jgi:hypothetical protein